MTTPTDPAREQSALTESEKARLWDAYAPLLCAMLTRARIMMPTKHGNGRPHLKRVQFVLDASALCETVGDLTAMRIRR